MNEKRALRLRKRLVVASAGLATIYSEQVEKGCVECYQQIAFEISSVTSGGNTRARLFIEGHGYKHPIEEQQSPAADNLYTYSDPIYVFDTERLALEIDQAQVACVIQLFGTGYSQEKEG